MVRLMGKLASLVLLTLVAALQVEVPQGITERSVTQQEWSDADEKYTRHHHRLAVRRAAPLVPAVAPVALHQPAGKQRPRPFAVTQLFLKNRVLRT